MALLNQKNKRNALLGFLAVGAAAHTPVLKDALEGVVNASIGGQITVQAVVGVVSLFAVYQVYKRKI